jgi:hypothetical protein
MTPNTLQRFRPVMKFCTDWHFIYITAQADEHKEQLQSYYKLMEEDLEEITKEWPVDLLILVELADMSNPNSPEITHKEQDTLEPSRMKNTEEVQDLSSASGKTASISPDRGGDDEVEELNGKGDEPNPGEVTPPRDEVDPLNKRKVSPPKPSSQKKSKATVTKMKIVLIVDDFDFIIATLNDASLEIVEKQEAKKEEMYDRTEVELRGVQQTLQSSRPVSTTPLPSGEPKLGDEPAQLCQLFDAIESRLRCAQEEVEQATQSLK